MTVLIVSAAWRNVFRNRRRSAIVIVAVAVAVAGALFVILFSAGMMAGMVTAVVRNLGHIQIQHPGFADNPGVHRSLSDAGRIVVAVEADPEMRDWAPRVIARGLVRTATASAGVQISGVEAAREERMTGIAERIEEGGWLTGASDPRRREIVIGVKLSDKLGAGVGKKVVLTVQARVAGQDEGTEMTSGVYRVVGVFRMASDAMNESVAFLNLDDAQALLGMGDDLSQVSVLLSGDEGLGAAQARLAANLSGEPCEVRTWQDGNRVLVQMVELFETSILIYVVIIFLGAAFGIVNTMLMAVFERTREFGILRAIGTGRWALFRLVIYEALFISVLGTLAGIGLIGVLHALWLREGLDLSMFAESLALFGSDAVIAPAWHAGLVAGAVCVVLAMGVLSAVWPAARAARVQPAEAMRRG